AVSIPLINNCRLKGALPDTEAVNAITLDGTSFYEGSGVILPVTLNEKVIATKLTGLLIKPARAPLSGPKNDFIH
ncbi:MAG: hypothetical protein GXY05_15915, partial [Clostridiales bacterium]|nr:hypothetical protein [Clostridiales bacterium]